MRELKPVEKQWIFTADTLNHTPSRGHGISLTDELQRRKVGVEYMRSLALRANLGYDDPNQTAAKGVLTVAATLLHRFYMRRSLLDFSEKLIAPTILFLASKIEEEPLKLRYIVNAFLAKFYPQAQQWNPASDKDHPSQEHKHWEKEVLTTEEIVLETLCFDMGVEQPWVVLKGCLRGVDLLWVDQEEGESSRQAEERGRVESQNGNGSHAEGGSNGYVNGKGKGKGKERFTENMVSELGWVLLNESTFTPLPILHPPQIQAYTILLLSISLILQLPLSSAHLVAAELAYKFGLDIDISTSDDGVGKAKGGDLKEVEDCLEEYLGWCKDGLMDGGLLGFIPSEPSDSSTNPKSYKHYFVPRPKSTPKTPEPVKVETITIEVPAPPPTDITLPRPKTPDYPPPDISANSGADVMMRDQIEQAAGAMSPAEEAEDDVEDAGSLFDDTSDKGGSVSPPRYDEL